ncbi:hypothetical protein DER46DRAFT_630897 [Fusarium sp. MPI-SDFR-AT-0072]|nr:hypothetical protein DER46DRAFT_630897 [Fusarium sp. MPI-SDFR-AT-0072]
MTSTNSDAGEQKLRQSFTASASQAVDVSPHAAIWISDDETDTEDEDDDEGQDFDDSQSCTTPTISIADHLDSTGTKDSPAKSEAAIGMDTTPAVSPARVEDDPIWTHDPHMDTLADPEPNQQSPCQTNRTSAGDSTACTDASLDVSPTNPEGQPCLGVSDEQQLVTKATGDTNEPGIMIINTLSDKGSCHGEQNTPTEVSASTSRDDDISGAHTSSPAVRLPPKSQQEQDFDHTSYGSSDAKSESSEAKSGSPSGARMSPPSQELPSPRRSRRRSSHAHGMVQDTDSDVDTEGSGSEDGLDVPECVRDEDYCPSPPKVQGSGSEDDDIYDEEHQDRKRRKVSRSPSCSIRNAATSARDSRRRRRSTRAVAYSLRERDTSALGVAFLAQFQEWQLKNVSMKRITENGQTTFQFQFERPLCTNHPQAAGVSPDSTRSVAAKKTTKRAPVRGAKYSDDEDNFLIQLKEEEQLGWAEIRRRFAQRFPERGGSGLQVHYCTKLKDRGRP